jgi:CRP-like cAMP-binding protein
VLHLKTIEGFDNLNESLISEINRVGKIRVYPQSTPAMDSDDTMEHFYIVLEGCIKVFQYNPENNKEQTLYLLEKKDFFDVLTVLDEKPHEVYTMTLDTSQVLELPIKKVREWIYTNPAFNKAFFPYLSRQFRQVEELATDLSLYDTSTRLIKLLMKNLNNSTKNMPLLHKLSHEDIASLIGTARQVVNRQLQELKKEGIINIRRKKITLENINKLIDKVKQ